MAATREEIPSVVGGATIYWYEETVILETQEKSAEALAAIAAFIEGQAKINITDNDQIDTGFMRNSIYWRIGHKTTYGSTWASGSYEGSKTPGGERNRAPQAEVQDAAGYVAVGADYAIYQELANPFLFPALQAAAAQFNTAVKVKPF